MKRTYGKIQRLAVSIPAVEVPPPPPGELFPLAVTNLEAAVYGITCTASLSELETRTGVKGVFALTEPGFIEEDGPEDIELLGITVEPTIEGVRVSIVIPTSLEPRTMELVFVPFVDEEDV